MAKMRHWKQRWDPKAPMRFRKTVRIGEGVTLAGSPVTEEHRALLGKRIRNFWESGFIERDDQAEQPVLLVPETGLPAVSSLDVNRAIARNEQAPPTFVPSALTCNEQALPTPIPEQAPRVESVPLRSVLKKLGR